MSDVRTDLGLPDGIVRFKTASRLRINNEETKLTLFHPHGIHDRLILVLGQDQSDVHSCALKHTINKLVTS
jgi:hypothetical protein